jgi:hypothetical protein
VGKLEKMGWVEQSNALAMLRALSDASPPSRISSNADCTISSLVIFILGGIEPPLYIDSYISNDILS